MNAAHFFFEKIKKIYIPEKPGLTNIPDDLFYYLDAVIFELHAASQLLLQIINVRSGLNQPTNLVSWSNHFQKLLKKADRNLFDVWAAINSSAELHVLEAYRQHIAHRGGSLVSSEFNEKGEINFLSIPIRWRFKGGVPYRTPSGKSIELLDEIQMVADYLNQYFSKLNKE